MTLDPRATSALHAAALISDDESRHIVLTSLLCAFNAPDPEPRPALRETVREWAYEPTDQARDDLAAELHHALTGRYPCMEHVRRHPNDTPSVVAADAPSSGTHPTLCDPCRSAVYPVSF